MSTILQKQLAAIAASSTKQLDLKAQRAAHGKSLLFEPKVAVTQDFNSLYQLCYEGYQELCLLDSRFQIFAKNLFSEQSKSEERTLMSAEENKELDTVIDSFLCLISARMLLKPAIKAVEWLVRRFRIHEYNTDCMILTFLPYHSTPLFSTLLSILPPTISPAFRFLQPYMATYANPPRQTIVYTAIHTQAFFSALNQYVLKVIRNHYHSSNLLSFWASVTTQAIDGMLNSARSGIGEIQRQREEDLLFRVLPILNECLTFKDIPEVILGSYMMVTVLVSKATWGDKVLDSLMEAVVASRGEETIEGCLVCLAVIAEEREAARFPRRVSKSLLKIGPLASHLDTISQQCRVSRFALGCALMTTTAIHEAKDQIEVSLIEHILFSDYLDENQVQLVLKELLNATKTIAPQFLGASNAELRSYLANLLSRLSEQENLGPRLQEIAKDEEIDMESIELSLEVILSESQLLALPAASEDTQMTGSNEPEQQPPFEKLIQRLEGLHLDIESFLSSSDSMLTRDHSSTFMMSITTPSDRERFLKLASLAREQAYTKPLFGSFFLHFACGPSPATARVSALHIISDWLRGAKKENTDLQAVIPYVVCALADRSPKIRQTAADCCRALATTYEALETGKKKTDLKIWGQNTIYEAASNIQWLKQDESRKFLSSVLLPNLEECILDSNHIGEVVRGSLSGSKHTDDRTKTDLKSSARTNICAFLSGHAAHSPVLIVRLRLISILSDVGKIGSAARVAHLLPAAKEWFSLPTVEVSSKCSSEHVQASYADQTYMAIVQARDSETLDLLISIITGNVGNDPARIAPVAFQRLQKIWPSLKRSAQQALANILLEESLDQSLDASARIRHDLASEALRSLELPTDALVGFVESLPSALQMPEKPPATKRRRTSKAEMARVEIHDNEELSRVLRRITLVLELVEGSRPGERPELLRGLFYTLAELQHYKLQTNSNLVYLQILTLGSLLSIVEALKDQPPSDIDTSVIRADLIVDCIRHSANNQVQNAALLLISNLATWVPEIVLHSVMPIFTFMGSTLLKQSDDYSAHVIDQTVSRVIPPLAASLRKHDRNIVLGVSELLLSFIAAFEHIPLHRRLGLFTQLIKTLGPEDALYAVMAMLVDKYPTDSAVRPFLEKLVLQFDSVLVLDASTKFLALVEDSVQPKQKIADTLLSLSEKSEAQVERSVFNLISSLAALLHSQQLRHRLGKTLQTEAAANVRSSFSSLIEQAIRLSHQVKDHGSLQSACTGVLSNTLGLLPITELINAVGTLLESPTNEIRRTALKALEVQVEPLRQLDPESRTTLLAFLPRAGNIIEQYPDIALKHSAISCIDQISEKFGKKDISAVLAAAQIVAGPHALGDNDPRLRTIALLCLASMVDILQDNFIPLLPTVLPQAFKYLGTALDNSEQSGVQNAVYALLCALVEKIPFMISGDYLDKALTLSHLSGAASVDETIKESRLQFYHLVAKQTEAKDCFAAIERTWEHAATCGYTAFKEQLIMLSVAVSARPKSTILKNTQTLFSIFFKAFDLRRVCRFQGLDEKIDASHIIELESTVNEAALSMTMKLNDASFRPFFIRLVEWGSNSLPKRDAIGKLLRSLALYKFLTLLFGRLKSIVTSYSSYILEDSAAILSNVAATNEDELQLSKAVLGALSESFDHDQDDFWQSPSHFTTICSPLISQLTRSSSDLIPSVIRAISALAASASSMDHHKSMNLQILKLFRAEEPRTRLAAVKCQQALTEKLGEEWLSLLPEMLPFISEAQEDDDEDVEREIGVWIAGIEGVLGESLEGMLQ